MELVSQVRRGSRPCCPVTTPSPSSASCSAFCWCMAAGPTYACAVSSATSSTRTLLSPWCTSGSASSVDSLPRLEIRGHVYTLYQSQESVFGNHNSDYQLFVFACPSPFSCRRCMISTSSHSTTLSTLPSLCWPWGYLTRSVQIITTEPVGTLPL